MLASSHIALLIGIQFGSSIGASIHYNERSDSSSQILSTFDDLPSAGYVSDPTFYNYYGYYGHDTFQYLPNKVPTPYNSLTWNNFYVMNATAADADPIIAPASASNIALAYSNETLKVPSLVLNETGATSFSLSSCYIACFIDEMGTYEGYGGYGSDDKIASNCTVQFDAELQDGTTSQAIVEYQLGCTDIFVNCQEEYRPMQLVTFQNALDNIVSINVTVTDIETRGSTYVTSDTYTSIFVMDSCEYSINY